MACPYHRLLNHDASAIVLQVITMSGPGGMGMEWCKQARQGAHRPEILSAEAGTALQARDHELQAMLDGAYERFEWLDGSVGEPTARRTRGGSSDVVRVIREAATGNDGSKPAQPGRWPMPGTADHRAGTNGSSCAADRRLNLAGLDTPVQWAWALARMAREDGGAAFRAGKPAIANPHGVGRDLFLNQMWTIGWKDASACCGSGPVGESVEPLPVYLRALDNPGDSPFQRASVRPARSRWP